MKSVGFGLSTLGLLALALGEIATARATPTFNWTNRPETKWTCKRENKGYDVFSADHISQIMAYQMYYLWGKDEKESWGEGREFPQDISAGDIKGFAEAGLPELCSQNGQVQSYPIMIIRDDTDTTIPGPFRVLISSAHQGGHKVYEYAFCGLAGLVDASNENGEFEMCSKGEPEESPYGIKNHVLGAFNEVVSWFVSHT